MMNKDLILYVFSPSHVSWIGKIVTQLSNYKIIHIHTQHEPHYTLKLYAQNAHYIILYYILNHNRDS